MSKRKKKKQRNVPIYRERTMQVPAGTGSIFDALEKREINARAATVYIVLNAHSNWSTGITHKISYRKLGKICGWCTTYLAKIVPRLMRAGFVTRTSKRNLTSIYELTHHNCPEEDIPLDTDGRPLKVAVSFDDKKGPLAKLMKGKITWQAFLVWNVMHNEFDWGTQTGQIGYRRLQKATGLGQKAICEAIECLEKANLLKRLERIPHEDQGYQLYPMKLPDVKRRRRAEQYKKTFNDLHPDKDGWYQSHNKLYRFNHKSLKIELRGGVRERWRPLKDIEIHQIPRAIAKDFKKLENQITSFRKMLVDTGYTRGYDHA